MRSQPFLFTICIALAIGCNACGGYSSNSSNCFFNTLNVSPPSASADHNLAAPGNSQQFQAFAQRTEPEPERRSPLPWIVGIAAAVVVIGAVVTFLALS